jgi:hypothetical protein
MKPRYVDVFISHKSEDAEKAQRLKERIVKEYHLSCWIDADDREMKRIQESHPVDYKLLTDRIREHLRTCRCLIFAHSTKSGESLWMPWELGFFDGRWGRRLIGLYDLDQDAKKNRTKKAQSSGEAGIPEFAQIYREITPETLTSFLQYARSPRALSDRADVDIDRWSNLVAGTMRDPMNVSIDALQFWISYHRAFWGRAFGFPGLDLSQPFLDLTEVMRTALDPLSKIMRSASPGEFDSLIQKQAAGASHVAQDTSGTPESPRLEGVAQTLGHTMRELQLGAVDGFVKLLHDASADAQQMSR